MTTSASMTNSAATDLRLELRASATIEVRLDLVAWYAAFNQSQRSAYLRWAPDDDEHFIGNGPYADWEKPALYAEGWFADGVEVSGGFGSPAVEDRSEVDEWETPRVVRPYIRGERPVTSWTDQDYRSLLAAIPWLAALDVSAEDRAEIARTMPGPLDQPLPLDIT